MGEQVRAIDGRVSGVESTVVAVDGRVKQLEVRLNNVEQVLAKSDARSDNSPRRADEDMIVLVVGTKHEFGKVRPTPERVATVLGIKPEHQTVTFPGSAVVQVMGSQTQMQVWTHKCQNSTLWIQPKRTPVQQRAWGEWSAVKAWFLARPTAEGWSVNLRQRKVVSQAGANTVWLNQTADRVVWADDQVRMQFMGRPDVSKTAAPDQVAPGPAASSSHAASSEVPPAE